MSPNDDWRVRVRLHEQGVAHALTERMDAADLKSDLQQTFHDTVIVSTDGPCVTCYAGTRELADASAALIRDLASAQNWQIDLAIERWHPSAQQWADADAPLPESDAEQSAERAARIERERAQSAAQGYPEYEVRVALDSRDAATAARAQLAQEGLTGIQRHNYLLLGADDEDSAAALAERVRVLATDAQSVTVEATGRAIADDTPANPFAIFGGLGG